MIDVVSDWIVIISISFVIGFTLQEQGTGVLSSIISLSLCVWPQWWN